MRWDSKRPVPWKRLVMLFAVYAVVANLALLVIARDSFTPGAVAGMAVGMLAYLALAWVLVKLGWNPPALRPSQAAREGAERRAARAEAHRRETAASSTPGVRGKPAPTRRTNATNRRAATRRR